VRILCVLIACFTDGNESVGKNYFLDSDGSLPCCWAVNTEQVKSILPVFLIKMLANRMRNIIQNQVKWGGEEK
jgi:hypothetical protein